MKKLLLIAYSFPPVGASRSRRALFLTKYLKEEWKVFVLTPKRPRVPDYDETLMRLVPPTVTVIRTSSWEPSRFPMKRVSGSFKGKKRGGSWLRRIGFWIFCPDSRIGWIPFALWRGWKIISKEQIDAIMVIGEPFSSFLIGVFLKRLTHKPLVLDFRDEWVPLNRYRTPDKPSLILRIEEKLEAFVIRQADRITSVTPEIIGHFKKRYPAFTEKFFWISNGFDSSEYPAKERVSAANGKWTITYAGSLYANRSPQYFFEALEALVKELPSLQERLRFIFLGSAEPSVEPFFQRPLIRRVTERLGFMPYSRTLEILCKSHLLLAIGEKDAAIAPRYVPGKLFEYLGAGRYILALGEEGCVKDILEATKTGCVVPANDVEKIKETLKELFHAYTRNALDVQPEPEAIAFYRWNNVVRSLASLLNNLEQDSSKGIPR